MTKETREAVVLVLKEALFSGFCYISYREPSKHWFWKLRDYVYGRTTVFKICKVDVDTITDPKLIKAAIDQLEDLGLRIELNKAINANDWGLVYGIIEELKQRGCKA